MSREEKFRKYLKLQKDLEEAKELAEAQLKKKQEKLDNYKKKLLEEGCPHFDQTTERKLSDSGSNYFRTHIITRCDLCRVITREKYV